MERQRLLIIGCGMSGGKLAEEIVQKDPSRFEITIIGEESYGNYNRIKLVHRLTPGFEEKENDDFYLQPPDWFLSRNIKAVLGSPVVSVDKKKKTVYLKNGKSIQYDILVLATGSTPFVPGMKGLELPGVFAVRTIEDISAARNYLLDKTEVLVIGGGLLGLELAITLKDSGKSVTVSHLVDSLMEFQLGKEAGLYLQKKLERKGMKFIMANYVTELVGTSKGVEKAIFYKDCRTIETQAVFFSCGIRPNTGLAKDMEIRVNKGIAVDDRMQTSEEGIYAIGECSEHRGKIYGLVAPVWEQARILAGILCGNKTIYEGSDIPPTKLKSEVPVYTMGRFKEESGDEQVVFEDPHSLVYKKLIITDNRLIGVNIIGEDLNIDSISLHYTAKLPLPERRADLLFPGAKAGDAMMDASGWPDNAKICDCNNVSAGKIRETINTGADTLVKVMNRTRAGTGCGSCRNKIKALLISTIGELREDPSEHYYVPGITMDREELTKYITDSSLKSVSQVFASLGIKVKDDPKTRMGLDYLLNYIWKGKYQVEFDSRHANDRYFGNIQKDGKFSVIPRIHGGVADLQQLKRIVETAEEYGLTAKITGADRIALYSVDKKDLQDVWRKVNMDSGHAYTKCFRAAKSCVGTDYCRYGLGDSTGLAEDLDDRYRGTVGPAKFKMGVSGCPRNCAEATIKDFGVVAVDDGWEIYVGGNGGAQVIPAKKLTRVNTKEEVIAVCDRFYEYYRKYAKYLERSAYFVDRIGMERILDAVLRDTTSNLKKLEADFREMLTNYKDPWSEMLDLNNLGDEEIIYPVIQDKITLCEEKDIEIGSSRQFKTEWGDIAVFHTRDGKWIAAGAVCPHKQGPIVDSIYGAGRLHCPIHNYSFDCATGESNSSDVGKLDIYPVILENNQVRIGNGK